MLFLRLREADFTLIAILLEGGLAGNTKYVHGLFPAYPFILCFRVFAPHLINDLVKQGVECCLLYCNDVHIILFELKTTKRLAKGIFVEVVLNRYNALLQRIVAKNE